MELLLDLSHIRAGEKVAVALSGGRDSVVLLHAMLARAPREGFSVCAIHVEHGIRGDESLRDEQFVRDLCKGWGVDLLVKKVDVLSKTGELGSVEQTARVLRYRAFDEAVSAGFCDRVATAHHRGDNAETVLMRALRGTGIGGLSGIDRERGAYVRPMLDVSRADINRYADEHGIEYVEDGTNACNEYTRNFIRGEVLPLVEKKFPQAEEALARLARLAGEADGFIRRQADALVTALGDVIRIKSTDEPVLAKYALKLALEALGEFADVEERHFNVALRAMTDTKKTYDLPSGLVLERVDDGLALYRQRGTTCEVQARIGRNEVGGRVVTIEAVSEREEGALCFSTEIDGLVLRGRKEGDSFHRFGGGRKSLGDYFTDIKMPLYAREDSIVLARGSDILAVVGVEIADSVKVNPNSKNIYKIQEEKA